MADAQIYFEVAELLAQYWSAVEDFRYADALDLLDETVEYRIGPGAKGKDEVAALLDKRSRDLHVRHFLSGFRIQAHPDHLQVKYNMVAFGRIALEGESRPFPSGVPSVVADMDVDFLRRSDGLKIMSVRADIIFQQAH